MGNCESSEVQAMFNWKARGYDEYIAGYKLYKRLKNKWDAIENAEALQRASKSLANVSGAVSLPR